MANSTTIDHWSVAGKLIHWSTALLIFIAMILGWAAELWPLSPDQLTLFVWHKVIGITVLGLVALRILWRLSAKRPSYPEEMDGQQVMLAKAGHLALYLVLILMPLSGWIVNSAANFPFRWFGLFEVPSIVAPNEQLQQQAAFIHLTLFWALLALIVGHAFMAIFHHVKHKNHVLTGMLPKQLKPGIFLSSFFGAMSVIVLVGYFFLLMEPTESGLERPAEPHVAQLENEDESVVAETTDLLWQVDYEQSSLGFTATYAGSTFKGIFSDYQALIYFDPANPESGLFDVTINTSSVTTFSADRDGMLGNADWFNFEQYPEATYITRTIRMDTGNSYLANGQLTLKGLQQPVDLQFEWLDTDQDTLRVSGQAQLLGRSDLDRRQFNIGAGIWSDDETVGYVVTVEVDLLLSR